MFWRVPSSPGCGSSEPYCVGSHLAIAAIPGLTELALDQDTVCNPEKACEGMVTLSDGLRKGNPTHTL